METQDRSSISFAGFIISLVSTTAIHFGDLVDPTTGNHYKPDLAAAKQMIDLIALLQEKTKGNLSPEESKLVDDVLYELRLRYVQAEQEQRRIVEP